MLLIKVMEDGSWYATLDGRHISAAKVQQLIAAGHPYRFSK